MFNEFLSKNVDINMTFVHYDPEDNLPNAYVHVYRQREDNGWNMSIEYPYKEDFDLPPAQRHTLLPRKDYKNISTVTLREFLSTFRDLKL